jgi:ElaB/YqjD/DUF883 family membrane-anchored ribosome-binding protein
MADVTERPYGEPMTPSEETDLRRKLRSGVQRVQDELQRADAEIRGFVSRRPLTAVAIALGAGFLVGKLISRRRGGAYD